jgi:hypothetical protein
MESSAVTSVAPVDSSRVSAPFTEGFTTRDLIDAKALPDGLT